MADIFKSGATHADEVADFKEKLIGDIDKALADGFRPGPWRPHGLGGDLKASDSLSVHCCQPVRKWTRGKLQPEFLYEAGPAKLWADIADLSLFPAVTLAGVCVGAEALLLPGLEVIGRTAFTSDPLIRYTALSKEPAAWGLARLLVLARDFARDVGLLSEQTFPDLLRHHLLRDAFGRLVLEAESALVHT